jgi:hypothetical protein
MAREEQPSGQLEPCSAASSSGEESTSTADPLADYFIRHKARPVTATTNLPIFSLLPFLIPACFLAPQHLQLTKLDTLAGLAVRYNVTVSRHSIAAMCLMAVHWCRSLDISLSACRSLTSNAPTAS